MSIYSERKKVGAICGRCRSPDYKELPPYYKGGKPIFECKSCGDSWSYGYDGGKYSELAPTN